MARLPTLLSGANLESAIPLLAIVEPSAPSDTGSLTF